MKHATINNARIAYYYNKYQSTTKDKKLPTIVLVHGYTGSSLHHFKYEIENYYKIFQTDVIAFDLRGHGNSEPGDYENLPVDIYFQDFEKIMDHFEFEEVILIGASFGGFLVNRYAIKYPNKVRKMIIISSTAESSIGMKNALKSIYKTISIFIESNYDIKRLDPKSMKFLSVLLKIHHENEPPFNKLNFFRHFIDLFINRNWSILLEIKEKIQCPVLILHGDLDYVEVENAKKLNEFYQNSKLVIIPKYGHLPQRKNPQLIQKYISKFLLENLPSI